VNLLGRMKRMEARGGAPLRHELHERKDADPWTFIVYAAENPKPFVATLGVDGFHMTLNTGINHVGGRFFGWFEMPSDGLYWRQVNDERGIPGVVGELMRRAPTMIVLNAAALILWTGFLALVGVGVFALLSANQRTTAIYMLLLIAGFAFVSLSASAVRFGLRSPMEFALAVFFGAGLTELGRRLRT
jgi:hypothetical protein